MSVFHVVRGYQFLGIPVPDKSNLLHYIRSLIDTESGLFAARVGDKGDLRATGVALSILNALGSFVVCGLCVCVCLSLHVNVCV